MKQYFYINNLGEQKGPFKPENLRNENIKRNTFVWTNGMEDWLPAKDVEELGFLFVYQTENYPPQNPPMFEKTNSEREVDIAPPMPKTWLVESILITLIPLITCGSFLSLLGIVGIVSASKVESQYKMGDFEQAIDSAKQAKRWTLVTFWITIGWVLILVILVIVLLVFAYSVGGFGELFDGLTYSI